MLKVKSGDLDKLGLLYERHKKRLFGFFYNLGNNPSISEDLVQNVFVRMMKYRGSYTGEGSFTAWMFRMARNINYDHHQKASKFRITSGIAPEEVHMEAEGISDGLEKEEDTRILNRAMAKLSQNEREVLVLSKYRELKFREIGEILGCSEGAAKVRVHRALKELKRTFLELEIV